MKAVCWTLIGWGCLGLGMELVEAGKRPVHTYSIVARDEQTGEMGVAVQSHWFSVGSLVPWGEGGVGVVATQSFVDVSYGPLGLELMRAGKTAQEALGALLTADSHAEVRQVAMLDARGNVAVHTGEKCIPGAGHVMGKGYAVQANLMDNERVWPAMARAFEEAQGDLAERMLRALEAAQEEGGDIRGQQSAALLIVAPQNSGRPWQDRRLDLRVEDHPRPLEELRRLLRLHRAYEHMNRGDQALERGDTESALREYSRAEELAPENLEMRFWHAVTLVNLGRLAEALPRFRSVFERDPNWARLLPRLPPVGLLQAGEATLAQILQETRRP